MKHKLLALGIVVLAMVAFGTYSANAQTTTANGPYYATPSWDQTLPSSTRFIVLSNMGSAAVLDRETGLVWERSPSTNRFTWLGAQSHCNTLSVGNRKGWKLPAIQELASLIDPSVAAPGPTLPSAHPFKGVQLAVWSATTYAVDTRNAWAVGFSNGLVDHLDKARDYFVWCVRGGQGVDPQ